MRRGLLENPVLFYDGDCGFCQGSVQFILKHEKQALLKFAPLQGEFAKQHLPKQLTQDLNSLVVLSEGKLYIQSDAILFVAQTLAFPYSLAKIGKVLPANVRNKMYKVVAQNRFKLSKMSKSCKIPTTSERLRFVK